MKSVFNNSRGESGYQAVWHFSEEKLLKMHRDSIDKNLAKKRR
jgi:hypothetical protein